MVGKSGKLNETIEVSALWSIVPVLPLRFKGPDQCSLTRLLTLSFIRYTLHAVTFHPNKQRTIRSVSINLPRLV